MGLKHPYKTNGFNYEYRWAQLSVLVKTCTSYGIPSVNEVKALKSFIKVIPCSMT